MGEISHFPYEKVTVLNVPIKTSSADQVLADVGKLDLWSNRLDSEYPVDDINYNEGKDKISNPFHKISKHYGRNGDVFQFLSTLRDENLKAKIMENISNNGSTDTDTKVVEDFSKKMKIHLNRTRQGELDAEAFLKDPDLSAFFHGYHVNHPGHPRNIHENLNVNVAKPRKSLDTSGYFTQKTAKMSADESELKRVKIYGNGKRIITVLKDDTGKRNYAPTSEASIDLEIGWVAKNFKGKELFCVVILNVNEGKTVLKKMAVEGEEHNSVVSISELARQNTDVLVRNKNLHDLLDKLVVHRTKEAAIEIACVVQSNAIPCDAPKSREKLTVQQVPKKSSSGEEDVYADFGKLDFSQGPFSSSDELNYNDGLDGNPFDKIAKVYGRQRNVFLFNSILMNPKKRAGVLKVVEEKCSKMEDPATLLKKFTARMDTYVDRISKGALDAKEVLSDEIDGFYYGCFVGKPGHPRNIHSNLNVNIAKNGQSLETTNLLTKATPMMEAGKSKVERVKLFGNGKRIMTIVAGEKRQRNYLFSKLAKMDLEIEWIGRETRSGREVTCSLVLEFKAGQISIRTPAIDGVIVKLATIYAYALENNEVLIRNKSLSKVVEEVLESRVITGPPLTIESIKAKIAPRFEGVSKRAKANPYDCGSQEILTIIELMPRPLEVGKGNDEHPDYKELLNDYEKLDFSAGPFEPEDKINYNEGLKACPFNKIRKYYGRHKDIFLFIATLYNEEQREIIMKIVKRKCGDDTKAVSEFEQNIKTFLDRACQGRLDAIEFMGQDFRSAVVAFFDGYHVADQNHMRNIHSNLNIDVGEVGKKFVTSDYFSRQTPRHDLEKGELERMKIYGFGKRVATVVKLCNGKRNYTFTKLIEMNLNINWKAIESESGTSEDKKRDCSVVMKIKNGDVTICKASIDGKTVQPASILELAKQNDKVLFKNKTLYDVIKFYSLRAVIKGATTLFFTAASGTAAGDASALNNNCTDVFLMLMLQDEEEKERILELVSKRSAAPAETRKEFLSRMDLFKTKFENGDYVAPTGKQPVLVRNRKESQEESSSGTAPRTKGNDPQAKKVVEETGKDTASVAVDAADVVDDYILVDESDIVDDEGGTGENQESM